MVENVRVDKWLWAVRVFKTRSQASEACRKGHVSIGEIPVKPSRIIHSGEILKVRKAPITRSYKILALVEKRMSAKLTVDFIEDVTPGEELELLEMQKNMKWVARERGTGRPTKKDRRELEDFFE
ncbi:MAG: RNA-binding S4 domain-containing protein [Prolixibacteraceae bacterium]|jgi:ribosome-associated heat shock protein Hsp15|nr:RNA-binding S4 domain-containing protein [Prolixibacteraceae bacterium]MBT6005233.1 RNA-binding S4 domain-containing protein [Prolixibacteraceae bacterium]MBT6999316.1 RNA-binding S4 domain-containing protein [Prolixibacteraceae bacterium]MBT7393212.1 RNA-binding S4 domain-containing protein [Prolixibacteraceae bacterium]